MAPGPGALSWSRPSRVLAFRSPQELWEGRWSPVPEGGRTGQPGFAEQPSSPRVLGTPRGKFGICSEDPSANFSVVGRRGGKNVRAGDTEGVSPEGSVTLVAF